MGSQETFKKKGTGKLDICGYPCEKDIQGSAMSNVNAMSKSENHETLTKKKSFDGFLLKI